MSYKNSPSSVIRALIDKIRSIFQEPWDLAVTSYRTSKFVLFFQIINIVLFLYIGLKILPNIHLEKISIYLQAPQHPLLFLISIYFIFKVLLSFPTKEIGLSSLLTTNLELTLFIFFILCISICMYNFYFTKFKNYFKLILLKI